MEIQSEFQGYQSTLTSYLGSLAKAVTTAKLTSKVTILLLLLASRPQNPLKLSPARALPHAGGFSQLR
jgi:hypothetical protein